MWRLTKQGHSCSVMLNADDICRRGACPLKDESSHAPEGRPDPGRQRHARRCVIPNTDIEVPPPADAGRFVIKGSKGGRPVFNPAASNGQAICTSVTRKAPNGIDPIRKSAPDAEEPE